MAIIITKGHHHLAQPTQQLSIKLNFGFSFNFQRLFSNSMAPSSSRRVIIIMPPNTLTRRPAHQINMSMNEVTSRGPCTLSFPL
jgi:hypothetical protein